MEWRRPNANDKNARLGPGAEGTPRYFHFNCRRRGLGPPDGGQEQDCWQHGSNRKHVPKHRVDLRSSRRASQYEEPNGAATAVALTNFLGEGSLQERTLV